MRFVSRPNEMADTTSPAKCYRGPLLFMIFMLFLATVLLPTDTTAAEVRHVRHKRTVSDFVEGLMNAMYFHVDPLPLPPTVIARITHLPATSNRVYKYVPAQKLKLSKLRARQIAEPKLKLRYPKKFSIKTEDSSLTLLKNDLPWTLHPLPPPLPTLKTINLEVDKSMPWALHPLPPPMKTKNYSDYYWPAAKAHPKYPYRPDLNMHGHKPSKNYHLANNYKYYEPKPFNNGFKPSNIKHSDFKPSDYKPVDYKPVDYKPDDYKSDDYKYDDYKPDDYKHIGYKQVDYKTEEYKPDEYKSVDYKQADYKSPDYKNDYPKHADEEQNDNDHHSYDHSYSHDDHSAEINDLPSPSSPPPSTEYVSHITIEPSIQIASFSETQMQGDGTNKQTFSQADTKQGCQCIINGHRHKRHTDEWTITNGNSSATANAVQDSDAGQSSRNSYITPNVGHATDVQILKSHDITDQSLINNPIGYVKQVRNMNKESFQRPVEINRGELKKIDTTFRDDSDKFKVDFGRDHNAWEKSKSDASNGRLSLLKSNDDRNNGDGGSNERSKISDFNIDDFGNQQARKPNQGRVYQFTKSKVENSDRGVAFSLQTPFSVSSFSSNIRHPVTEERQSKFRFNEPKTTSSPVLSSFQSEYSEPLDFEQFGLQSALMNDKPPNAGQLTAHYLRGFNDKPSETISQLTSHFPESFSNNNNRPSDYSGRFTSHFSRDFGNDDRSRSKPFHYNMNHGSLPQTGRFNSPLKGSRTSSEELVLDYFQPIVVDFDKTKDDKFKSFGNNNGGNDKLQYFSKTDLTGFSKFKKNQNSNQLRLPGGLHESNENLSRKMIFHPSTFDID